MKNIIKNFYISTLIFSIADFLFGSGYLIHMNENGISNKNMGFIFMIWTSISFISEIPSGYIADRFGRKKILSLGLILYGFSLVLFANSNSAVMYIGSFVLMGLGASLFSGTPQSWFLSFENSTNLEKHLPKARSLATLVSTLAGLLFGLSVSYLGNSSPYLIGGISCILYGLYFNFKIEEINLNNDYKSKEKNNFKIKNILKNMLSTKEILIYIIFTFIIGMVFKLFIVFWQLFAANYIHIPEKYFGMILSMSTLSLSLGLFLSSKLENNFKKNISLTLIIMGISMLILCYSNNFILFLIGVISFEISFGLYLGLGSMWIQKFIKTENRSTIYSIFSVTIILPSFIANFILSYVSNSSGIRYIWFFSSLLCLISILVINTFIKE